MFTDLDLEEIKNEKLNTDYGGPKQYLISSNWYENYLKHQEGGEYPGKVITSTLVDSRGRLKPFLREDIDYKSVNEQQWRMLAGIYQAEEEVSKSKRSSYKSVSSGGYGDITQRNDNMELKLPGSARKEFKRNS